MATISMQDMRHLNLFEKVTKVRTRFCFEYNNALMFGVPKPFLSQALGKDAQNLKKINYILRKRIRIIPLPDGEKDIKNFISNIVSPVEFKDLEIEGNEIILNAGSRNKAALIGRNRRRFLEMQKILHDFFGKEFKIV